jgi:hypothetical protein
MSLFCKELESEHLEDSKTYGLDITQNTLRGSVRTDRNSLYLNFCLLPAIGKLLDVGARNSIQR